MSKFENEQEKKVRESIESLIKEWVDAECNSDKDSTESLCILQNTIDWVGEEIMLRIRPYLKVQKKWMGDAL